ncbi:hypothetical protein ABPG72_020116 [Tetrahymena utriculariae]
MSMQQFFNEQIVAFKIFNKEHEACFCHQFQLCIKDFFEGDTFLNELLKKCCSIVTYYNKSNNYHIHLQPQQLSLDKPQLQLLQDISTRWNSTFYMIQRLIDQKVPLQTSMGKVYQLQPNEWEELEKFIQILQQFEYYTLKGEDDQNSISSVIPYVKILIDQLEQIKQTKLNLEKYVERYFQSNQDFYMRKKKIQIHLERFLLMYKIDQTTKSQQFSILLDGNFFIFPVKNQLNKQKK